MQGYRETEATASERRRALWIYGGLVLAAAASLLLAASGYDRALFGWLAG